MLWYETHADRNARATCRHFGIAPKVFYAWRKRFDGRNLATLEDRSHRPKRARHSSLTGEQIDRIVALRKRYLHYSKLKLAVLYREQYGQPISSWKIQQVIQRFSLYPDPVRAENAAKRRRRARQKRRITELMTKPQAGFLFSIDTVVRRFEGDKRYILTAVDRFSRFAYARMYSSHSSRSAADFLRRLHRLLRGQLIHIQTDNGSEFHMYFENAIQELKLQHWWSRVKTPKDNAVCERFNRTIQEEFISQGNGCSNVALFNQKLMEWLIEYDFHRPHAALGYRRPAEFMTQGGKALPINPSHTTPCHPSLSMALFRPCPSGKDPESGSFAPPKGGRSWRPKKNVRRKRNSAIPRRSGDRLPAASASPSGSTNLRRRTAPGSPGA
jgi:transposase InsO family protein